ncbi:hypothetical protein SLEP1_g49377 [Rubroshorea leprosula]|uniref:Retrotransposon gag domain-containing protein n=1 Tax=Rubroshorea leprosula TaxID=152421 RepID=A0AAV5LWS0_9ROSI|nr:hypothetical protein SLEP1_g49377 [Rubroshorea leprosula]
MINERERDIEVTEVAGQRPRRHRSPVKLPESNTNPRLTATRKPSIGTSEKLELKSEIACGGTLGIEAGFLGSPFPPRSRPAGDWSKTWSDAGSLASATGSRDFNKLQKEVQKWKLKLEFVRSPGPEITAWRYTSDPDILLDILIGMTRGFFIGTYKYLSRVTPKGIGVSTPRIHLGALQVDPEHRYGLKKDFWSARGGNSSQPVGRGQVPSNLPPHPPPPMPNVFPRVDHTEGGDENQPHNSAHNSASTANQDVVTTQLVAMQQQFGVFQQVLAQLLVRNNPGDPLINLLNPAPPQPPAPLQNPEQIQHAPAAQNASDALMCKIFLSTLRGNARTWYYSLPPRSINSYTELASAFATKFSSRRLIRKTTSELMRVNSFDQAVGITAVISGLGHERFRDSLLKHPATTFSEVVSIIADLGIEVSTPRIHLGALQVDPEHRYGLKDF